MSTISKPFLKWAGGKRRLLKEIMPLLPSRGRLVEPFAGSAALFLGSDFDSYLIADSNPDLINLYMCLCEEQTAFINEARQLFTPQNNNALIYYKLRDEFNECLVPSRKALLFLYLNRHTFNGLCRYNSAGRFNSPFGRYVKPYFPEVELKAFVDKCSCKDVSFICAPFERTFALIQKGDAVYCDPPYHPLSATANFTSYASVAFTYEDQKRLAACANVASELGAHVVISNHDLPVTRELYKGAVQKSFPASRTINCQASGRQRVMELLAVYEAAR